VDSPPRERFTRGPCNVSRAHTKAPTTRRAGKEPVPEYDSDSDTAPGRASDSNPLFGFYSDSAYEFDFGSDPEEPESEDNSTEQPLSGPVAGLVITSTPVGRFVYWLDRKPADLTGGNSRCVAYLDSLPFQEGTPLAPAGENTPTEVATSDSSLGSPDRQVFMTTNETPGPSGTVPDQYLEDIFTDELSADAPANETAANRDARRERNRKRSERRCRLRDSLPIRNLTEALDQVKSRVHTTPEQCLMSITTIAHQAQGMRAGQVIAKLAEDAYFMRVNTRVAQPPPVRNRDNEATSRNADIGRNRTRAELPANPNRTRATADRPSQGGNSAAATSGDHEVVPHPDPGGGGSDGGSSNRGANRRAGGEGDRGGRGHANSHASGASQGGYDARQKIEKLRCKKASTSSDNDDFPAFSARLRNLLLLEKLKPLGITKYDAKQDPVQWLRCYALSIENAGGNNDTKCLYFPFCLDQAPLTWLESLEKYSIDKWDQLKEQFASNFAGVMGRSGTRMDPAMVKQEQGEALRKYMRRFFDKRATVVDVSNKEVIDLFQDGLYHHRTFEDFGRRCPSSITHLKDMITSWADEEDKANANYDAISGKSKQNTGDGSSNNGNQGGRNSNNYSGPNRKHKPDNIKFEVADFETSYHAILGRPAIAKFMAVPHYTYLVLKMPSPAGVLSLQVDLKISHDCDTESVEIASTNQVPNAMMEVYAASKKLTPSELDIPEKSDIANKTQPAEEVLVKTIDLGTGDCSKTTTTGAGLDPK
jgi:hypothetical protein